MAFAGVYFSQQRETARTNYKQQTRAAESDVIVGCRLSNPMYLLARGTLLVPTRA